MGIPNPLPYVDVVAAMETIEGKQQLHDDHLKDLIKSGLSDVTIARLGFKAVRPHDIKLSNVVSAYSIPYFDMEGQTNGFSRQKLFPPRKTTDGHTQKYSQPEGSSTHLYLPPLVNWLELALDPTKAIVITEGEKKSAKACQEGLTAMGVAGVWCWRSKIDNGEAITLPVLDEFNWKARRVEIVPDSDAWRPEKLLGVLSGFFALAKDLERRGARVLLVKLPDGIAGKTGLDDWLCNDIEPKASFEQLERLDLGDERLNRLTAWHQRWRRRQERTEEFSANKIGQQVNRIRLGDGKAFEKNQDIARIAMGYLSRMGNLIRTHDGELLFFDQGEKLLQPLEGQDFLAKMCDLLGLNPIETETRFVREEVLKVARLRGERKTVHQLAYWDVVSKTLHISKNDGTMFLLDGTTITEVDNGENGVLFKADGLSTPIAADLSASSNYFHEVFEGLSLDGDNTQLKHAHALLKAWVLSIVFIEALPVRPILVLVGEQGSGKTSLARRIGLLLYGARFQVAGFRRDQNGEGDFLAAVTNQRFTVFDNADSNIPWLGDHLARIATGAAINRRRYHTTNDLVTYAPNCFLGLTSRDTRWNRGDVTQRLLPVKFHAIATANIPESTLQQSILSSREQIWGSMLHILNRVVAKLREDGHQISSRHRLADFDQLGRVIGGAIGIEADFIEAMNNLSQTQQTLLAEGNERFELIASWLRDPANPYLGSPITAEDLFHILKQRYQGDERAFPFKSPTILATWAGQSKELIHSQCGIVVAKADTRTQRRWMFNQPD
jgi:hypothetical protein